jgi:hypothetical protein
MQRGVWAFCSMALAGVLMLGSCAKMPNDGYPIYIQVDSTRFEATSGQGGSSNYIPDVWMEANNDDLGASEIPVTMPVLQENRVKFLFQAGIRENGASNNRRIYPFYTVDTLAVDTPRLSTIHYTPKFRYIQGLNFNIEDFETAGLIYSGLSKVNDANVRYGLGCGMIYVSSAETQKIATMDNGIVLNGGQQVYMELDYKSDNSMEIGLLVNGDELPIIALFEQPNWNKLYLNLSDPVSAYSGSTFKLYYKVVKANGSTDATVYLDNIKLIYK